MDMNRISARRRLADGVIAELNAGVTVFGVLGSRHSGTTDVGRVDTGLTGLRGDKDRGGLVSETGGHDGLFP